MTGAALDLDYRDLVIEQFSTDERDLLERLASAEDEREIYRALAQEAIHALAKETREHQATRDQFARERDQYRQLRASITKAT